MNQMEEYRIDHIIDTGASKQVVSRKEFEKMTKDVNKTEKTDPQNQ